MQWTIPFVCYIFISVLVTSTLSFNSDVEEVIDSIIENNFIPQYNITGFGLGIVKFNNGTPDVLTKGYKFRDVENQIQADENTLFAIGSITKSFTATIIVKTLSEMYPELGETVLDSPIRNLLPSMNFTLSDRFRSESTTFRDLLAHRTCLHPAGMALAVDGYANKAEFLYRLRYAEEYCSFRTNFVYNNGAYFMAGEIIAQMANSTFEDMLTNFLKELGMTSSRIIQKGDDFDNMPNMSRCYYNDNGEIKRYNSELLKWVSMVTAAGGILSTSEDMVKYMQFHLNNGKVGDKQVVSEVAIEYLRRTSIPLLNLATKINPEDTILGFTGYGLGLLVGLLDGWESIAHDGSLPPYYSYMSFYPALKLGIYSVSNGPTIPAESLFLHELIYNVIEKGLRQYDPKTTKKIFPTRNDLPVLPTKPKNPENVKVTVAIEDIVGLYGHPLEGYFIISEVNSSSNGSLYFKYGTWGTGNLRRVSETNFAVDWDTDIKQLFAFLGGSTYGIDFGEEDKAIFTMALDGVVYQRFPFVKNATLDSFPVQPWSPDSCAPISK